VWKSDIGANVLQGKKSREPQDNSYLGPNFTRFDLLYNKFKVYSKSTTSFTTKVRKKSKAYNRFMAIAVLTCPTNS